MYTIVANYVAQLDEEEAEQSARDFISQNIGKPSPLTIFNSYASGRGDQEFGYAFSQSPQSFSGSEKSMGPRAGGIAV